MYVRVLGIMVFNLERRESEWLHFRKLLELLWSLEMFKGTDRFKLWTNFRRPPVHVRQNILRNHFTDTYSKPCSLHFFWNLLSPKKHSRNFRISPFSKENVAKDDFLESLRTHFDSNNWPICTQKVSKRRNEQSYEFLTRDFQKYFV